MTLLLAPNSPMISCGNGTAAQRNLHQVFLGVLDAFTDRVGNFAGFAEAEAHGAVSVADDDERSKGKDTAAPLRFLETRLMATTQLFLVESWERCIVNSSQTYSSLLRT